MGKELIMVSSITYAYKARDLLNSYGIKAYIQRIPAEYRTNGCGYGVRVSGDAQDIAQLLGKNGIKVRDIIKE